MTTIEVLNAAQLTELRGLLEQQRTLVVRQIGQRRQGLASATASRPDEADWASDSVDQGLIARLMDRDVKLLREIDRALTKIEAGAGTYGVCEATGEPIGFERLRARPWSRLSLGAKEGRERDEAARDAGPESGVIPAEVA